MGNDDDDDDDDDNDNDDNDDDEKDDLAGEFDSSSLFGLQVHVSAT